MQRTLAAVLLGCALGRPATAQDPAPGVFIMGQARFTVLAPECIRIEYSTRSLFIDDPSLFAGQRQTRYLGYSVEQSTGRLVLDTGRIRLTYAPDGWPLSVANLKAEIRVGTQTVTWTPECNDESRLDAARSRDWAQGRSLRAPELSPRAGWSLADDSEGRIILKDRRAAARPAGHGTDWFLFGYGLDAKAGLRAVAAVCGAPPLARRQALDRDAAGAGLPPRLRSQLQPYTDSAAWQTHAYSLPIWRPLHLEFPRQEEAYRHPEERLYGDSLLAAAGPVAQDVWLPEGDWYELPTGRRALRLYAKGGVPLTLRPASGPQRAVVLRCYPGRSGETGRATLYEDGGSGGDGALTEVSYLRQGARVRIKAEPTQGGFKGQRPERAYSIELPGAQAIQAALDGKAVPAAYSAQEKLSRVSIPARGIRQGFTLYVWLR
ncbi:MAG: DUF5110 domain-containing protein [Elusimicrobia bacterium]|nr:DUF5110 domain-containing protein [Elusimicrobiota bacterium]